MQVSRSPGSAEGVHDVETDRRQTLPQALHHEVPALRGQASMPSAPRFGSECRSRTAEQHLSTHAVQDNSGLTRELLLNAFATFRWPYIACASLLPEKRERPISMHTLDGAFCDKRCCWPRISAEPNG